MNNENLEFTPNQLATGRRFVETKLSQRCLLCDNTRELPLPACNIHSWVCDDCREAMAFVKELRASVKEAPSRKEIKADIALL